MIYLKLFLTFLKIGAFTFGGGYAMLPLMQNEVAANNWMTPEELVNFIAVSESTPGVLAINAATYIGAEVGGFWGSVCATLGVVVPSFVIILIVARFLMMFSSNKYVLSVMKHLKPAVVGLIGSAVITLGQPVFLPNGFKDINIFALCFSIAVFALMLFLAIKKKHPILLIGLSAALGIAVGFIGEWTNIGTLV
ncbi:MAG: chromate transporter [Clostridia bacterium]|nr:chromate transporter [Clostridia bacterium]